MPALAGFNFAQR